MGLDSPPTSWSVLSKRGNQWSALDRCNALISKVASSELTMALHRVATTNDLPPGSARVVEVAGKAIGLFNVDGVIYAIDNVCTHDSAPLSEGVVSDGCIVCPWHGAQFDLATGQAMTPPAVEDVNTYEVVLSGEDICLQID